MPEETVTQTEVTQGNDPAIRTETGEIKNQQTTPPAQETKQPEAPAAEKKPDASTVPDKYELKAPEGSELDPKLLEEATPLFKEFGLNNEQAQKLVDFHAKAVQAALEGPAAVMDQMRTEWRGEVVKDPTLGNGTDNLKAEVRANISRAIEAVGDAKAIESFKEAMDLTGAGDNPALIRGLNAIGKLLSEGTLVRGGAPSPLGQTKSGEATRPSPAQALYPSLPSSANS